MKLNLILDFNEERKMGSSAQETLFVADSDLKDVFYNWGIAGPHALETERDTSSCVCLGDMRYLNGHTADIRYRREPIRGYSAMDMAELLEYGHKSFGRHYWILSNTITLPRSSFWQEFGLLLNRYSALLS